MKKILWILIGIIGSILVSVIICLLLILNVSSYKQSAFESINAGEFDKAAIELLQIEKWEISDYVDPDSVISFVNYSKTINFPSSILDSLYVYVSSEYEILGEKYHLENDYTNAFNIFDEQYIWNLSYLGNGHPKHIMLLNNLGLLSSDIGNYVEAEQYYIEALTSKQEIVSFDLDYATLLSNLGTLYTNLGDYKRAEKCHIDALNIRKSILGTNSIDYAISLNNLGTLYCELGNYISAKKYFIESLNIKQTILGNLHLNCAVTLSNLGVLYGYMGEYEEAERYVLEALDIRRHILGVNNVDYATSLHCLGSHRLGMGDYEQGEKYLLEALRIRKQVIGENHPDYAISLNNLGTFYSQIGNYDKAENYYIKALDIRKSIFGTTHPEYASSISNLGSLYDKMGEHLKAEQYKLEALRIRERILEENHPDYITSLNNLGAFYSNMGNYEQAKKYYQKAASICYSDTVNKPLKILVLNNLGELYLVLGDEINAYLCLKQSFNIQKSLFLSSLDYMTENQRMQFWKTMQSKFDETYPIFAYKYHFSQPSISTFAYDNELFRKGLLLSSSNIIRQSIFESNDSILIEQWNELVGIKQVIMNLEEKDPTSTNLDHYKNQADSLEKIVTKSSAIFRETKQQQSITWDSIQQYLNPDEVAIEYFIAPLNEDSTMYCALLLRHDSQYPELIPLCEEKEIVNCLSQNRTNDIYTFDTNSKTIFNLIWDKILPQIHEGETIYFSPAGLLHQIAIENIPYNQTHTMSDVYTMVRLSSTREIVKKDKNIKHHTATIYGGIFYDVDKTSLLAESRNYDTEDMFTYRSISSTLPNRGSVLYLPGTKHEAESIHSLLNSNNITSTLYTASKANEESFKSLSGKHRNILHIGTHGFYWEDSTARKQDYFSQRIQLQMLGDYQLQKPSIDPLTRCGLLFAGSNIALSGHSNDLPEGVQDGILTAKEISLMDLRDADLVVLSACETAKGDITSEGIFGLQRAFKMAGVQTIIMSLWKINDQATQMLMTEFYTNWISKNQSKREAFKNAQNTVRAKFEEPEYWAGFILLD